MKKNLKLLSIVLLVLFVTTGCSLEESETNTKLNKNIKNSTSASSNIIEHQPAPTDLDYSLERYNLIKRAYWVNGMRDKARTLPSPIADMPLGYIVLMSDSGAIVGKFVVDGKVSSLGSYLFPAYIDQDYTGDTPGSGARSQSGVYSVEISGIDGAYGSNVEGIFFFTTDGKYIEWTGDYLYSDIPFEVNNPIVKIGE